MKKVSIFTDGACSGNPGIGGWGAILDFRGVRKEISGYSLDTTNNQMELTAVIEALSLLKESCEVLICTDSKYVLDGWTKWLPDWQKNNWKTSAKKDVKNQELWQKLIQIAQRHKLSWQWVKGHNEHPENERCDEMARNAILRAQSEEFS